MAVTFGDKVEYESNGQQVVAYVVALRRDGYAQVTPSVLLARVVLISSLLVRTVGFSELVHLGPPTTTAASSAGLSRLVVP